MSAPRTCVFLSSRLCGCVRGEGNDRALFPSSITSRPHVFECINSVATAANAYPVPITHSFELQRWRTGERGKGGVEVKVQGGCRSLFVSLRLLRRKKKP